MSGEVSRRGPALQYGPRADAEARHHPFTSRQLARIDEALTLSSRESGLTFSVYVGSLEEPHRGTAESLFEILRSTRTSGTARGFARSARAAYRDRQ